MYAICVALEAKINIFVFSFFLVYNNLSLDKSLFHAEVNLIQCNIIMWLHMKIWTEEILIATNILFLGCLLLWGYGLYRPCKNTFDHISSLIQFLDKTF